jgi:hypothetical protein
VVGADRIARKVTASRTSTGSTNDLWWAVTGGGGGNFGVITKYWFRSAGATGTDPGAQLPRPPAQVLVSTVAVPYATLTSAQFAALLRNFGTWHEQNSAPSSPYAALSGVMFVRHKSAGSIVLVTQVDGTRADAAQLLSAYATAITAGTGVSPAFPARTVPWLASTKLLGNSNPTLLTDPTQRSAAKSAYLKKGFTDDQIAAIYANVTRDDYSNASATLQLGGSGGAVNALAPAARATVHRDSVIIALYENYWVPAAQDSIHLGWLRDIYRGTFAATGGYPVPNDQVDGCYINCPDPDILDPAYNASGVSPFTLYYKDNFARLQQAKAHWDPTNFFRHPQSVPLP